MVPTRTATHTHTHTDTHAACWCVCLGTRANVCGVLVCLSRTSPTTHPFFVGALLQVSRGRANAQKADLQRILAPWAVELSPTSLDEITLPVVIDKVWGACLPVPWQPHRVSSSFG